MVPARQESAESMPPPPEPRPGEADRWMRAVQDLHGRGLYRFFLQWTFGEHQAAEDLLQETLLRAWRNIAHLNADPSALRPWLFTVARRIAIDATRAKRTRPTEIAVDDMSTLAATEDDIERLLDSHALGNALSRLSLDHRRVILEIYYHGRSVRDAAEVLGVPEGTVKSRTHHGLRALRGAIESVGLGPIGPDGPR